ncbi:lipoxygenase [Cadophora sp. MPI-SDFR-AT-0126]|nr:lipoxygenase [Leotiomycetes sp. MPI-SDFR-AT-0126]
MAFGRIFSSFTSSSTLKEKPTADSQVPPAPTFQIIKTPVIINTTPAAQPKGSLRWVKSLGNPKSRPRPTIPDFVLTEESTIESKVGLNIIKLFQDVDSRFSSYFDLAEFEPSDRERRTKRSIDTLRRTYQWQELGSTSPPYPPCLRSIPRDEQTGLLQIFNAERLIDTTVALLPDELQPKLLAAYLYGEPIGKTMAGIEARMKMLTRANKNIGTQASQAFTGSNPTTIAVASTEWIEKFKEAAKTQGRNDIAVLLQYARAESFLIQDCSFFREAVNAAPDSTLKSDDGKRFGCASVTLYQLREDGTLHPLAIIIDFKISIEESVVIFNKRLTPVDSTSTEEQDWAWRYAKMCSQVADWTRHEIQVHLNDCHFVEEATIVAAQRSFTGDHIVYRLLEPHWLKTLSLNASARSVLVPKVVTEINGFSKAQTYEFILNSYKRFNWTGQYIPADLERRGFPISKLGEKAFHNYAWARNMVPLWNTLYNFVSSVLKTVYMTDADVEADKSVESWCNEMHSPTGGQMPSFPDITTIDELTNAVVMCIHTASPQHNSVNYLQCYYMSFVPNKPACLNTPLPTTLEELMSYREQDVVAALPVHDEQVWLLSSQLPYLLSYGVSEDQTLLSYAKDLEDEASGEEGEKWKAIKTAASNFYIDLMKLGVLFDEHSKVLDDKNVPYNVLDPSELAVSILI